MPAPTSAAAQRRCGRRTVAVTLLNESTRHTRSIGENGGVPVAGPGVALVGGAGERRADALAAAVAGVVEGAGVAVVAARAGERRHRAARCPVAGPGVALVGGAGERRADAQAAAVAGVVEGAGVAIVAARARERRHRAARCPVAG